MLADPLPGACHAGQPQQPGRRAAHDPRGAGRHRGAGDRGGRQPARGDRRATARSSSPTIAVVDQRDGRATSRGSASLDGVVAREARADRRACRSRSWAPSRRRWPSGRAALAREVITAGSAGRRPGPERSRRHRRPARPRVRVDGQDGSAAAARAGTRRDNAMLAWAVAQAAGPRSREPRRAALRAVTVPGGRGELIQVGRAHDPQRLLQRQPALVRGRRSPRRAALRGGRRLVFVAGTMRELGADARALHARSRRSWWRSSRSCSRRSASSSRRSQPWAGALGDRLLTAADAPALGPLLAARLRGDEVVVLKASRGVALERILPAITGRAAAPH